MVSRLIVLLMDVGWFLVIICMGIGEIGKTTTPSVVTWELPFTMFCLTAIPFFLGFITYHEFSNDSN